MKNRKLEEGPATPRIGSGTYNLSEVREQTRGNYSMTDQRPERTVERETARMLKLISIETLDRLLRSKRDKSGYVITLDATTGGMCMAFREGVAIVTVHKGNIRAALFTPTDGGSSLTLTEGLALELLEEEE